MFRLALVFVTVVCIAGCMIGPNYQRPPVDTPASFRFQSKETAETANTSWWKQFNDPVLR